MRPIYQSRYGREGNCLAACFASLLEVPLALVDFSCFEVTDRGGDWYEVATQRLQPFSVRLFLVGTGRNSSGQQVLALPRGGLFIGTGPTERGPLLHSVIYRYEGARMQLVHDPHPHGSGLAELREVGFLVPDVGRLDIWAQASSAFVPPPGAAPGA